MEIGLIPGDGGGWLLPRVAGLSRAAEMTFTGEPVDVGQVGDIVAVQPSAVRSLLEDGRIRESGRHDELIARGGFYADLHRRQLLEGEVAAA